MAQVHLETTSVPPRSSRRQSLLAAESQLETAQGTIFSLRTDIEKLRKELERSDLQTRFIHALCGILQAPNLSVDNLVPALNDLSALSRHEPEISSVIQKILEKLDRLRQDKINLTQSLQLRLAQIQERLNAAGRSMSLERQTHDLQEARRSELARDLGQLTAELDADKTRLAELKRELAALEAELNSDYDVSQLQSELSTIVADLANLQTERDRLQTDMRDTQGALDALLGDMAALELRKKNLGEKRGSALQVLAKIQATRDLDDAARRKAGLTIDELEREAHAVATDVSRLAQQRDALDAEHRRSLAALAADSETNVAQLESDERRLQAARAEIRRLQQDEAALLAALDQHRRRDGELRDRMAEAQGRFQQEDEPLKTRLQAGHGRLEALRADMAAQRDTIGKLELKSRDIEREHVDTTTLIASIDAMARELDGSSQETLRRFNHTKDQLTARANAIKPRLEQVMARIQQHQAAIPQLQQQLAARESQRDAVIHGRLTPLQAAIGTFEQTIEALEARLAATRAQSHQAELDLNEVQSRMAKYGAVIAQLQDEQRVLASERFFDRDREYLASILPKLQDALALHRQHHARLQQTLQALEQSLRLQTSIIREAESLAQFEVLSDTEDQRFAEREMLLLNQAVSVGHPAPPAAIQRIVLPGLDTDANPNPNPMSTGSDDAHASKGSASSSMNPTSATFTLTATSSTTTTTSTPVPSSVPLVESYDVPSSEPVSKGGSSGGGTMSTNIPGPKTDKPHSLEPREHISLSQELSNIFGSPL